MRKYALWGAGLIALYIAVANYKGFAADANATAKGDRKSVV